MGRRGNDETRERKVACNWKRHEKNLAQVLLVPFCAFSGCPSTAHAAGERTAGAIGDISVAMIADVGPLAEVDASSETGAEVLIIWQ